MLKITYHLDPTVEEAQVFHAKNMSAWLLSKFSTKEELLDLRFFNVNMLGDEIDTSDGTFLELNEGEILVTHDSTIPKGDPATWIYIGITLLTTLLTYALIPDMEVPEPNEGRGQSSATNELGAATNKARINQRIDDIFGTVNRHTPPLWQVPYRIGVNNQEVEILLLCVGRGRYEVDENRIFDGDTPYKSIPDSGFSLYGPDDEIGVDAPELQIGADIDQPIGIYSKSNDLNPTELVPPNDLASGDVTWLLSISNLSNDQGVADIGDAPEGWDARNYYTVGDNIVFTDTWWGATKQREDSIFIFVTQGWIEFEVDVWGGETNIGTDGTTSYLYEVLEVHEFRIVISLLTLPQLIKDVWLTLAQYEFPTSRRYIEGTTFNPREWLTVRNSETPYDLSGNQYFENVGPGIQDFLPIEDVYTPYNVAVGQSFDERVGPFTIAENTTKVICNFTSPSGFYNLNGSSEVIISATITLLVEEVDNLGSPTGISFTQSASYDTNSESARASVFQTMQVNIPYQRARITGYRETNRDKREGVSTVDKIEWRDLYLFEPVDKTRFGDVTLAHTRITNNSTSQLVKERRTNFDVTRKITEYLGGGLFGPTESFATDKFDQILIHTALDPWIGRLALSDINADGFLLRAQQIELYFGSDEMARFGYDFDSSEVTYQDTFSLIANVVNCVAYVQTGIYDVFFEGLQTESTMQITHRNKEPGTESRKITFEKNYDSVELTYRDELTASSETIVIPESETGKRPYRLELSGCITELQAWRRAKREYNKIIYKIEDITFDVDEFGRAIVPYQRIDSPDSTRFTERTDVDSGYRIYDGEVVEVNGLVVELSQPVKFTTGETHHIGFTDSEGNTEQIECTEQDNEFKILLSSLPTESIYDGYDRDKTKFVFRSDQAAHSLPMLPQTIEFNLVDGKERHTISGYNYTDNYYSGDLENP